MKTQLKTLLALPLFILALVIGSSSISAQDDVVDFGDSGEVVVVEQEGDGTSWAYWFYDEVRDYMPPLYWYNPFPGFIGGNPGDGGDGGDDDNDDECQDAINRLVELQAERDELLERFEDGLNGPLTVTSPKFKGGKKVYDKNSSGWKNEMFSIQWKLTSNDREMNDLQDWVDANCEGCCGK